jgi:quinol monooxygenase YgiN
MSMKSLLAAVAVCVAAGLSPGQAQDANPIYVVSYVEGTLPARTAALPLLRALRDASRKEPGNSGFEILQSIGQPRHFAVVESWSDAKAQASHTEAAHTKLFREKLKPLLAAPIDERMLSSFAVGSSKAAGAGAVYVLTHVDFIPRNDAGFIALKQSSADSAKDEGVLRYDVLQQPARPNHLTMVEVWRGMAAFDAHEAADHTRKFRDTVGPLVGSPYDQRLYRVVK